MANALSTIANTAGQTLADTAALITAQVDAAGVEPAAALVLLGQLAIIRGVQNSGVVSTIATEAVALITAGDISDGAALQALADGALLAGNYGGTTGTNAGAGAYGLMQLMLGMVTLDPALAADAGVQIAATIDVTSASYLGVYSYSMYASAAVNAVLARGASTATYELLAAIATKHGTAQGQSRDPLNLAGTALHTLVAQASDPTATARAIVAAISNVISDLGLTADAGVTLLLGLGATGHVTGNAYWADDYLMAAAAPALAALIHADAISATPTLTMASLEADLVTAVASTRGIYTGLYAIKLLAAAVSELPANDTASLVLIGSALGYYTAQVPGDAADALAAITALITYQTVTGDAAIQMLIGYGGGGGYASVQAGRLMERVLASAATQPEDVAAAVTAAIGTTLTADQAILVLAGIATATTSSRGQAAAWDSLATLFSTDTAAHIAALDAVVGNTAGSALAGTETLYLLANVAALSDGATAGALEAEILALAGRTSLFASVDTAVAVLLTAVANAGQYLFGAEAIAAQAVVIALVGEVIAALVENGALSDAQAVADVTAALTASVSPLDVHRALAVLATLQGHGVDATAVEDAIQSYIDNATGGLTAARAVYDLTTLLATATGDFATALTADIAAILYNPVNFAGTVGLGDEAQIAHVAGLISALYGADPTAAQAMLDGLSARIGALYDLSGTQAAHFLVDLYGAGGTAATAAETTIHDLIDAGTVAVGVFTGMVDGTVAAGFMAATDALSLLGNLETYDTTAVASALSSLILNAHATLAQLQQAVNTDITPGTAISAVALVMRGATGTLLSEAADALESIVGTDATLGSLAVTALMPLIASTDSDLRGVAYEALHAIVAAAGGGDDAYAFLLEYVGDQDTGVRTDARAELAALVADGIVTTTTAVGVLGTALDLSNPDPAANPTQVLAIAAAMLLISPDHATALNFIEQVIGHNGTQPAYGFTRDAAITAIANAAAGSIDALLVAGTDIAALGSSLTSATVFSYVLTAGLLSTTDLITLVAHIGGQLTQADGPFAAGAVIAAQIAGMSDTDKLAAMSGISGLIADDFAHLRPVEAAQIVLGIYLAGELSGAILLSDSLVTDGVIDGGALAYGIVSAMADDIVETADGVVALAAIGTQSTHAETRTAVYEVLSDAITGGTTSSTGRLDVAEVMAGINAAVTGGVITATQAFALVESLLLYRLEEGPFTDPAFVQATDDLQQAVTDEHALLISNGLDVDDAITALALAGGDAGRATRGVVAEQIVALAGSTVSDARVVSDILATLDATPPLTAVQVAAVLMTVAGAGDAGLQVEAGKAIGALYASGDLTALALYQAVYVPVTDGMLTPEQDLNVAFGIVAGGGGVAAGQVLNQLRAAFFSQSELLTALSGAISGGVLTATQAMSAGAGMAAANGQTSNLVAILDRLIATDALTPAAAVETIGTVIGTNYLTVALALTAIETVASNLTGADLTSMGLGLGELLANGIITQTDLRTSLQLAVNGSQSAPVVTPFLSLAEAVALLQGAAADTSAAALAAHVETMAYAIIATLTADNPSGVDAILADIFTQVTAGTLTVASATAQLIAIAGTGADDVQAAVTAQLRAFAENGLVGVSPANGLSIETQAIYQAGLSGAIPADTAAFMLAYLHSTEATSDIGALVNAGLITAAAAVAEILAAADHSPTVVTPALAASALIELITATVNAITVGAAYDADMPNAALAGLIGLINAGDIPLSTLTSLASTAAGGVILGLMFLAGTAPILTPDGLESQVDVATAALATTTDVAATLRGIATLTEAGFADGTDVLGMMASISAGSSDLATVKAVAEAIAGLLADSAVTEAEVLSALGSQYLVAAMLIDGNDPAGSSALFVGVLEHMITLSGDGAPVGIIPALVAAVAVGSDPGLTVTQAIAALGSYALLGNPQYLDSAAEAIAGFPYAASTAFSVLEQMLLDGAADARTSMGALIAAFAAEREISDADLIAEFSTQAPLTAARLIIALRGQNDAATASLGRGAVDWGLIGAGLDALVNPTTPIADVIAQVQADTTGAADDQLDILIAMGLEGDVAMQAAAGRAVYALVDTFDAATLTATLAAHVSPFEGAPLAGFLIALAFAGDDVFLAMVAGVAAGIASTATTGVGVAVDNLVTAGELTGIEAVDFLSYYVTATGGSRAATDAELAKLATAPLDPTAVVAELIAMADTGGNAMLVELAGRIAALAGDGVLTVSAAITQITASGLASDKIVTLLAAGAVSGEGGTAFAAAAGDAIAAEIIAGNIDNDSVLPLIETALADYRGGDIAGEITLLAAMAGNGISGFVLGGVIATHVTAGDISAAAAAALISAQVGTELSGELAEVLLLQIAATSTAAGVTVAETLTSLIESSALTAGSAVAIINVAVTVGQISATLAVRMFADLAAVNGAYAAEVTSGLSAEIQAGHVTAAAALSVFLNLIGTPDSAYPSTSSAGLANVVVAMAGSTATTAAAVIAAIDTAAVDDQVITLAIAATLIVAIANGASPSILDDVADGLITLVDAGLSIANAVATISTATSAGTLHPVYTSAVLIELAGAAEGRADQFTFDLAIGSALAELATDELRGVSSLLSELGTYLGNGTIGADHAALLIASLGLNGFAGDSSSSLAGLLVDGDLTLSQVFGALETLMDASDATGDATLARMMADLGGSTNSVQQVAVGARLALLADDGTLSLTAVTTAIAASVTAGRLTADQRATVLLSVAGHLDGDAQIAIGGILGAEADSAGDVATIAARLDAAFTAGALGSTALISVLAGIAGQAGTHVFAAKVVATELATLIGRGDITGADAMAALEATAGTVPAATLVSALLELMQISGYSALAAGEIESLIGNGLISFADATAAIDAHLFVPGTVVLPSNMYSLAVSESLLLQLAINGDADMQAFVGKQFIELGQAHGTPSLFLTAIGVDAAGQSGALSGEEVIRIYANMVANGVHAPDANNVENFVRLGAYAAVNLYKTSVSTADMVAILADAAEHGSDANILNVVYVIMAINAPADAVAAVHAALTAGTIATDTALDIMFGLLTTDGTVYDDLVKAELVAMVQAHELPITDLLNEMASRSFHWTELLAALAAGADPATLDVLADAVVTAASITISVGTADAFFTDALHQAKLDGLLLAAGNMTLADALADLKSYSADHDVSYWAALTQLLSQAPTQATYNQIQTAIFAYEATTKDQELAQHLASSEHAHVVYDALGNPTTVAADPNAISYETVLANFYGVADASRAHFIALHSFYTALYTGTSVAQAIATATDGSTPQNTLSAAEAIYTALKFDQSNHYSTVDSGYAGLPDELHTLLLNGDAADAIFNNYYQAARYSTDPASLIPALLATIDDYVTTALGVSSGAEFDELRSLTIAYVYAAGHGDATVAPLADLYFEDLVEHLAFITVLETDDTTAVGPSTQDKQDAFNALGILATKNASDNPLQPVQDGLSYFGTLVTNGITYGLQQDGAGRGLTSVMNDPDSVDSYVELGTQIGAKVAANVFMTAVFGANPVGTALTVATFAAKGMVMLLSLSAIQTSLGPVAGIGVGYYTILGATAGLLGNIFTGFGTAAGETVSESIDHVLDMTSAIGSGNAADIALAGTEVYFDYIKLLTGSDLRHYGEVAEHMVDLYNHLEDGNLDAAVADIQAMGESFLDIIIENPYLGVVSNKIMEYASTVNNALSLMGDSFTLLGQNLVTGALLVGTALDTAGNVLRDVAHSIGNFAEDVWDAVGSVFDGYIRGATVFADANYNGVLDPGEAFAITDANGHYTLTNANGPLVATGGIDTATGLAFDGRLIAPEGATTISAITTLIQKVAQRGTGDPVAAQAVVAAALGLSTTIDLDDFDAIAGVKAGVAGAVEIFARAATVLNTVALLEAAGATTNPFDIIASQLTAASTAGTTVDLSNATTIAAIAASSGVSAGVASTVTQLVIASNRLLTESAAAAGNDALALLRAITAVSISAQGETSDALHAAGTDAAALAGVLNSYTGTSLANHVTANLDNVGDFEDPDGTVSLKVGAGSHGIELDFDAASGITGQWVRFEAQHASVPGGVTLLVYAVDAAGNLVARSDHHTGADVTLESATLATVGAVTDDHGNTLFLGAQSVYLTAGEQLRFAVLSGNHVIDMSASINFATLTSGALQLSVGGLTINAITNDTLSEGAELAGYQRDSNSPLLYLHHGDMLTVDMTGSTAHTNTLGFVHIDVDGSGGWSVGGVAYGDTIDFQHAVQSALDTGFSTAAGGTFSTSATWTVAGSDGFYAPVLLTQTGEIFVVGTGNAGGYEYIRMYGENTFGFEDLAYNQGSDFDYNDMVMRLTPVTGHFVG
ncbi:hypothetical protein GCM10007301_43490 [Azorhizobium oxalatiphilum]|uniref:Uncharacterized protein n=2 Tax=Azorhizobium oxalatiphilum TaxID=980631 RepID=A0A917CA59_9HYPH|nr:hypothetical protein GCM10007301_43490 [Azorhizobium oxalatiphilum]